MTSGERSFRVASYNIHKAVGLDRRREPTRILSVLHEIDADVVALQEADRRFGRRVACLPRQAIDDHGLYKPVPLDTRPDSIGWHGNALLVRKSVGIVDAAVVPLPTLEPRGAIRADLMVGGRPLRVVGMHLDISGIRRRQQVRAILAHIGDCRPHGPTVLMGDLNEWAPTGGALREFSDWQVLAPGRSFHTRRPMAMLDRIILSPDLAARNAGVHHSSLAALASDHLPVWADIAV